MAGRAGGPALAQRRRHVLDGKDAGDRLGRMQRLARRDLVRRDEPALGHQLLKPGDPNLVVRLGEVLCRREALAGEPALVDVPAARGAHGQREGEGAPLPRRVEDGLVLLGHDRTEAHHAAHVLRAVHGADVRPLASRW